MQAGATLTSVSGLQLSAASNKAATRECTLGDGSLPCAHPQPNSTTAPQNPQENSSLRGYRRVSLCARAAMLTGIVVLFGEKL